jgi:hypothetical protein
MDGLTLLSKIKVLKALLLEKLQSLNVLGDFAFRLLSRHLINKRESVRSNRYDKMMELYN